MQSTGNYNSAVERSTLGKRKPLQGTQANSDPKQDVAVVTAWGQTLQERERGVGKDEEKGGKK